jgi:hypothetical protein
MRRTANRVEVHKPTRVVFKEDHVHLTLNDQEKKHGRLDITVYGLSEEERAVLLPMEGWAMAAHR